MDPDACLRRIFIEEDLSSAGDLADWLEKGGFLPRPLDGETPRVKRVNALLGSDIPKIIWMLRMLAMPPEEHLKWLREQDEKMLQGMR